MTCWQVGEKGTPWHFGEYPKSPSVKKHEIRSDPISADPFRLHLGGPQVTPRKGFAGSVKYLWNNKATAGRRLLVPKTARREKGSLRPSQTQNRDHAGHPHPHLQAIIINYKLSSTCPPPGKAAFHLYAVRFAPCGQSRREGMQVMMVLGYSRVPHANYSTNHKFARDLPHASWVHITHVHLNNASTKLFPGKSIQGLRLPW